MDFFWELYFWKGYWATFAIVVLLCWFRKNRKLSGGQWAGTLTAAAVPLYNIFLVLVIVLLKLLEFGVRKLQAAKRVSS